MDDLYKRLGVPSNASTKDIRSAYRRIVRTVHLDTSRSPETAADFAKVTEAYRILIDSDKRAQYAIVAGVMPTADRPGML